MERNILNYAVRKKDVKNYGEGKWNGSIMEVYYRDDHGNEEVLGEYTRNYPNFGEETFAPFLLNGKQFALYSKDYTCTRVMSLPDCHDIGGEPSAAHGFCPTDLWVPLEYVFLNPKGMQVGEETRYHTLSCIDSEEEDVKPLDKRLNAGFKNHVQYFIDSGYELLLVRSASFGLVAGCVWGDDSSWKLQRIDLSNADKGEIKRDAPWGYVELPHDFISLKRHVDLERGVYVGIQGKEDDRLDKQKMIEKALNDQFFFMNVQTTKRMHLSGNEVKVFDDE